MWFKFSWEVSSRLLGIKYLLSAKITPHGFLTNYRIKYTFYNGNTWYGLTSDTDLAGGQVRWCFIHTYILSPYAGNPYFAWHYVSCRVYFSICMAPWPKKKPRGTGSDIQVSVNTVLCKVKMPCISLQIGIYGSILIFLNHIQFSHRFLPYRRWSKIVVQNSMRQRCGLMLQPVHPLPLSLLSVSELMVGKNQQQHKKRKPKTYGLKTVNFLGQDKGERLKIKEWMGKENNVFIF